MRVQSVCSSLPGLKRTALPGGMLTSWPVRGLRPMPVLRGRTLNTPKRRNSIRSPLPSAFFIAPKTVSTASSALVRLTPVLFTTAFTMSSLITPASCYATASYARHAVAGCQGERARVRCASLQRLKGGLDVGKAGSLDSQDGAGTQDD